MCWTFAEMQQTSPGRWGVNIFVGNNGKPSMTMGVFLVAADSTDPDNHIDQTMILLSSALGQQLGLQP